MALVNDDPQIDSLSYGTTSQRQIGQPSSPSYGTASQITQNLERKRWCTYALIDGNNSTIEFKEDFSKFREV